MTSEFNFDLPVDRRGTSSYKWDGETDRDTLPLWVADMDFTTAPCIIDALKKRVEHGVFGYVRVPDSYYDAITRWFDTRHNWHINPSEVIYTSGVVPALSAIIKALVRPGEGVALMTPVYNCFFSSVRNNGCNVIDIPLTYTGTTYKIDFDLLEQTLRDNAVPMLLLCNPHNPCGRVWTRDELTRVAEICRRLNVIVVSDEIHCELVMPGYSYTPMATVMPECISCVSPSKAFNTAGLQIANIIVPDPAQRTRIDRAININEVCDVNPFGVVALEAAYSPDGLRWLEALIDYIAGNYRFMVGYCAEHLPDYPVCKLEGTYLAWMDIEACGLNASQLEHRLVDRVKLHLNAGSMYGDDNFIRWNLACPRQRLAEALKRFTHFVRHE